MNRVNWGDPTRLGTVLIGQPQRISFWRMLWTLLKRRRNYIHVFLVIGRDGSIKGHPCIGPLDWPEDRTPQA